MTQGELRAVVFDSGETLIDETRTWSEWADWLGIPRFTFMAVLGGVISRGEHHLRAFELLRPGFDLREALAERAKAGMPNRYLAEDLYPDARSCLLKLRADDYVLGIAGNYGADAETSLKDLDLPVDFVGSSERWGAEKPSAEFFRRLADEARVLPREIGYVGDRIDNDVVGATDAGMVAIFLHRGPWAILQSERPEASRAALSLRSLDELPGTLARWREQVRNGS